MAGMNRMGSMTPQPPLGETERKLLETLARQTGADPRALEAGYRSGNIQAIISALPAEKRSEAMAAVGDPKKVEAAKKMAQAGNLGSLFGKGK